MIDRTKLSLLCGILNRRNVKYAVCGGYACALNGHVRMTEDIDLLLSDEDDNLERTIGAIREIFPSLNEEIKPGDIRDNVVLKIIDWMEIDFSIRAWTVDYAGAVDDIEHVLIDGIDVPFLGIESLIRSKSTMREIDMWDVKVLRRIKGGG